MGFMDEIKKLTHPYDEDDEDFIDEAENAAPASPRQQPPPAEKTRANPFSNFSAESASSSQSASGRQREGRVVSIGAAGNQMQVVLINPERFETAAEIADHLRSQRPVLVNMEATPKEVTRRLVDFLSGVTYAIDGNIRKVAAGTYMLTPANVDLVTGQPGDVDAGGVYF